MRIAFEEKNSLLFHHIGCLSKELVIFGRTFLSKLEVGVDPHGSRGTCDDLDGFFNIIGVEVRHFRLSDFDSLFSGEKSGYFFARVAAAFRNTDGILDEGAHERLLDDEGVGSVFEDGDLYGEFESHLLRGHFVKLFEKFHHVDAGLTEGRTDWRSGITFSCVDVQLDDRCDFLCHSNSFPY